MIDTYGAANPLQCQDIKDRKDKTCEERYGDKDVMHNQDIFDAFGHLKCPKVERIAPDKTPTCRRFNWQKV